MEFVNNPKRIAAFKEKDDEVKAIKKALIKKGVLSENDVKKERTNNSGK